MTTNTTENDPTTSTTPESSSLQPIEAFKLAPFNPSSLQIQEKAVQLLKLSNDDVLFDLGCGDGRLLIAAAQKIPGLRCVGVDIDPVFVTRAQQAIEALPDPELKRRLDIRLQDVLQLPTTLATADSNPARNAGSPKSTQELTLMDDATALYLFILPKGIQKIMPLLSALVQVKQVHQKRPFRILSYMFKIREWEPTLVDKTAKGAHPIYLYEFEPPK